MYFVLQEIIRSQSREVDVNCNNSINVTLRILGLTKMKSQESSYKFSRYLFQRKYNFS